MISLTERTILDKRTLGCICDHGTTECKDIISLCDAHRGYCGVYVCNKGLQEILRLTALNDAQSMAVSKVHISSLYVIAIVSRGCRKLTQVNSEIPFNANNQDGKMSEGQMGESSKYFTPPAPLNNRGEDFSYIHLTTRFFGLRPLNDGKPMRNEQNGLVVMFSSAKHHKAQETKPDFNRNQIQNKLWQKQSNRNISTCVAQREVA